MPAYSRFIKGIFSEHITVIVFTIAVAQFLIALGLILNKFWVKLASLGGIIFGLAIAPLGVGSGFPTTVFMAIAFFILLKKKDHDFIWKLKQYNAAPLIS
jgi:NO-binding membrane sensor protein with MHYT domain